MRFFYYDIPMNLALSVFFGGVFSSNVCAHLHKWVDWGVGLETGQSKPAKIVSACLELTWDDWYSAPIVTDYFDEILDEDEDSTN